MRVGLRKVFVVLSIVLLLTSCNLYKQNIMLKVEDSTYESIVKSAEGNYLIKAGDQIEIRVFSNKGELIIDPNFQLRQELGTNSMNSKMETPTYTVRPEGDVFLPMIDTVEVEGLNQGQLDSLLSDKYSDFYVDAFVTAKVINRRVVVLGATGGEVIPLNDENMNVLEVLALAGGLENDAIANNIRLVRGDLNNPQVEVIDLSTIDGMKKATMKVQPNDVIYVEPVRKVVTETIRDIAPVITLLTSVVTLVILLSRTN